MLLPLPFYPLAESLESSQETLHRPQDSLSVLARSTGIPASTSRICLQPGGGHVLLCGFSVTDFLSLSHPIVFTPSGLNGHQSIPRVFKAASGTISSAFCKSEPHASSQAALKQARQRTSERFVTYHKRSPL